jgi:hypothetical protein
VAGHWGAVHGSRRPRKAAARKGASEAAALRRCFPGSTPAAYGGSPWPLHFPRLLASVPRCSRPGRKARRAEGALEGRAESSHEGWPLGLGLWALGGDLPRGILQLNPEGDGLADRSLMVHRIERPCRLKAFCGKPRTPN